MVPPSRSNTAESFHSAPMRQDSQASYFIPSPPATSGPGVERRPTYGSLHSQQSFSRPMPRNPSQASSFHQPFTPASAHSQPMPPMDSYEMTSQPSYSSLNAGAQRQETGGYVAFNPSTHGVQQRSATAPNHLRGQSSYGDIIDDYGDFTAGQEASHGARSVSQPAGPPRAHTAGPEGGGGWQSRF